MQLLFAGEIPSGTPHRSGATENQSAGLEFPF